MTVRLHTHSVGLLSCAVLWWAGLVAGDAATPDAETLFAVKLAPMLQARCLPCHGEDEAKLKGDLDLRTLQSALKGGASGQPALVRGQPEESPLYLASSRQHPDWEPMPPKEKDQLTVEQLGELKRWIAAGAPWPDPAERRELANLWDSHEGIPMKTSGGLTPEWSERRYDPADLWAYQPLRKPPLPSLTRAETDFNHPIDLFIADHWPEGATPAPPADRPTLLRRVTFDLIGLPPTPEELSAFLADQSPEAFSGVVERLLASPHYGERWGSHWLDVTRYADSSGLANDYERGNTWRYRDYVIRAFNLDKPYDQFIREQIAGDELNSSTPETLIAAGFLRMGPWELTGMEVPKIARQCFLDDVTDSVGQVFLAHPVQCARCHDHKFDPIPTRDYYSLQAVFATTQLAERPAAFLESENTAGFEERRYLETRQKEFKQLNRALAAKEEAAAKQWCAERNLEYIRRGKGLSQDIPEERLPPRHVGLTVEDLGMQRIVKKGLERLAWELDRYEPVAFSVYSGRTPEMIRATAPLRMPEHPLRSGELEQTCILTGGSPFAPTDPVRPGFLSALSAFNPALPADLEPTDQTKIEGDDQGITGRRRALANWITSSHNPLPARVMVNRVWLWHFGQGLAGNPNNFGAMGQKPTHPELLDWLAAEFANRGWSIKTLHRLILSSQTYQRAAGPRHAEYLEFKPRRLSAEELRDSMLCVSGELNPSLGGIPVRPEINLEAALQPRQVMGTFATAWIPNPKPAQRHRRSIYSLRLRGLADPFMEVFNQPNPDLSCEARDASTITPQVFSLFNSQITYARALAFAARVTRETASPEETVSAAFRLAFCRPPSVEELAACLEHWSVMTRRHHSLKFERAMPPSEITREAVEENTGEKFSFQETLHAMTDFVPDVQPADLPAETRGLAEVCLVLLNANEFVYVY